MNALRVHIRNKPTKVTMYYDKVKYCDTNYLGKKSKRL